MCSGFILQSCSVAIVLQTLPIINMIFMPIRCSLSDNQFYQLILIIAYLCPFVSPGGMFPTEQHDLQNCQGVAYLYHRVSTLFFQGHLAYMS